MKRKEKKESSSEWLEGFDTCLVLSSQPLRIEIVVLHFCKRKTYSVKLKYSTITIFYAMKQIIYLLVGILLAAALVSLALPSPIHASSSTQWCVSISGLGCFTNKNACNDAASDVDGATCFKK